MGLPQSLRSFAMTGLPFFLSKYDKNTRDFILLFRFFSVQYKVAIYKVGKNRLQRREIV